MLTGNVGSRRGWWLSGLLLLGVAVSGAGAALEQQAPAPSSPDRGQVLTPDDRAAIGQIYWQRVQAKLGLTDQQVTDIRTLLQDNRTAARSNVQALKAARQQLRSVLAESTADPAAIQSAATQVKTLQSQLFDHRVQTQLAIRAKLTAGQWQQWRELRQGMGHGRMRRGGGFGMGMM